MCAWETKEMKREELLREKKERPIKTKGKKGKKETKGKKGRNKDKRQEKKDKKRITGRVKNPAENENLLKAIKDFQQFSGLAQEGTR